MKKYQRMHLIFIRQYLKQIMEYKADFLVGVVGVFLYTRVKHAVSKYFVSTYSLT